MLTSMCAVGVDRGSWPQTGNFFFEPVKPPKIEDWSPLMEIKNMILAGVSTLRKFSVDAHDLCFGFITAIVLLLCDVTSITESMMSKWRHQRFYISTLVSQRRGLIKMFCACCTCTILSAFSKCIGRTYFYQDFECTSILICHLRICAVKMYL